MIDRGPEELWTEVHNVIQKASANTIPKKKKCKKIKWQSAEALQIAEKIREDKGEREKERYLNAEFPFECRVPKNSKER